MQTNTNKRNKTQQNTNKRKQTQQNTNKHKHYEKTRLKVTTHCVVCSFQYRYRIVTLCHIEPSNNSRTSSYTPQYITYTLPST